MEILRVNLLSPMVLAFVLGITAALLKSDLKIPEQVYSIISLYLLFSIGLKGGFDLAKSPLTGFLLPALAAMAIGIVIPVWSTPILRRIGGFSGTDAASIAIHYGAVSATTLSACIAFISELGVPFEGYMPTMYVVMELPAVLVGLLIARRMEGGSTDEPVELLRGTISGKSFLLLLGGTLIGLIAGRVGESQVGPFFIDLFPGVLTLFLLEMGMVVGRRLSLLREVGVFLVIFGMLMPLLHGLLGVWLGTLAGLSPGGSLILATTAASASFITAPATVRANIPKADAGLALTASIAVTFPFNLIVGIPLYYEVALMLA